MDRPLEIAFHNLTPSPALEEDIRKRVRKLEKIYEHLVGCRVALEARHRQHRTGNVYEVHIAMSVPGRELVVSHEPHRTDDRLASFRVGTALRDAFRVAEIRLREYKEQQRSPPRTAAQ